MVQKNKLNGVDLHPNDPDPALFGPPTQTISGVTNKVPVVDNPNIKLPSQEVKGLDANVAQQAATQAQNAASNAESQVQNAAGGIAGSVIDKLNPKGIKPDGLGKDWSPDKFSPEAIAGNDKFVDPKTGVIGSTSKLVSGLKGGVLGGGLGTAAAKLASVKKGLPKPKIPKPPSVPRIKTVKIPKPSNTKGATDLLNLPKSTLGI